MELLPGSHSVQMNTASYSTRPAMATVRCHQLNRVYFLCSAPYRSRPSIIQLIKGANFPYCARWPSLERHSRGGFLGYSSFGNSTGRKVARRFEGDDTKSSDSPIEKLGADERPPFDINIAVVLAGFAFEAYNTPSDNSSTHDTDPFDCKTIFISEQFLREVYDGQLLINLKKGSQFPGLDLWGTSDPYVVLRVGESVVRSKTIWATTEPVWNERFKINVKNPSTQYLQLAAWDANLVTDHRRLGNTGVNLEPLSNGEKHEVKVELEGMGGGGFLTLEVEYKSFEDIDTANQGWKLPLLSDFLQGKGLEDVFRNTFGLESLTARDFLSSVLGTSQQETNDSRSGLEEGSMAAEMQISTEHDGQSTVPAVGSSATSNHEVLMNRSANGKNMRDLQLAGSLDSGNQLDERGDFLRTLGERISQKLGVSVEGLGFPLLDIVSWDALDVIKRLGLESQNRAESQYVENGLAITSNKQDDSSSDESSLMENSTPSIEDIQKASMVLLNQTEETLKTWAVLAASVTGQNESKEKIANKTTAIIKERNPSASKRDEPLTSSLTPDEKFSSVEELEELRNMFGKAESAMEAWAVLATSLGHKSFVKSAFEKLCFLDNNKTDSQVAVWRDAQHHRLVVSFRGTEQVKWKDLMTDLMLLPVSFNPERVGGEFKEEAMVHGGFLNAYDSVRNRLMSLVKTSIEVGDKKLDTEHPWQVYVTGHSLGGALATLFTLELSTSRLSRHGHIKVTMYNFGSPRVGNKKFAQRYNEIVKDSWRMVNHRDIIPTVPRLMGYCHVAQPIYLTAGDVSDATVNMELVEDGYHGDVIGEATPDFILEEFMKGEKSLIERLLQTEITMLRAIRDGSALMQHMEDFYYISLLESVSTRFRSMQADDKRDLKDTLALGMRNDRA